MVKKIQRELAEYYHSTIQSITHDTPHVTHQVYESITHDTPDVTHQVEVIKTVVETFTGGICKCALKATGQERHYKTLKHQANFQKFIK